MIRAVVWRRLLGRWRADRGAAPYQVYRLTPVVVFGFGTEDDRYGARSTRWEFAASARLGAGS